MGAGTDWDWGRWDLNGMVQSVQVRSPSILSAANYQSIVNGATIYNLTGVGTAAAVLQNAGLKKLVSGSATLNVSVGQGRLPSWTGSFNMNNTAGDNLNFAVDGTITTVGQLQGATTAYSLMVNGSSFGQNSITAESIQGNLVGPGSGAKPITGAIGNYHFEHGNAAMVDGIFGADLNSTALP